MEIDHVIDSISWLMSDRNKIINIKPTKIMFINYNDRENIDIDMVLTLWRDADKTTRHITAA